MEFIDFTNMAHRNKSYGGANGSKISVVYNDELYMLKFPPRPTVNKDMSYTNSCVAEYIGCHILNYIGMKAQETLLGTYITAAGKKKDIVACKDFTGNGYVLSDFASLKNQIIDSERSGYGTDIEHIMGALEKQAIIDPLVLKEHFMNMFIADAYIGNWDRHNGNWGFLYNQETDDVKIAPLYDCGSSLYPQADEQIMKKVLSDYSEIESRIYVTPTSAITQNGKRINYFNFISSLENYECTQALVRMTPRIDNAEQKIFKLIDDISCISNIQKQFYKTMLKERKEKIIDYSFDLAMKQKCIKKTEEFTSNKRRGR